MTSRADLWRELFTDLTRNSETYGDCKCKLRMVSEWFDHHLGEEWRDGKNGKSGTEFEQAISMMDQKIKEKNTTEVQTSLAPIFVDLAKQAHKDLELDWIRGHEKRIPPEDFLHQFRTVKISHRRQAGHSTAAAMLLHEFPRSLVIVPTVSMICFWLDRYIHMYNQDLPDRRLVVSIESVDHWMQDFIKKEQDKGKPPFEFVIFDTCADVDSRYKKRATSLLMSYSKVFVWFQ